MGPQSGQRVLDLELPGAAAAQTAQGAILSVAMETEAQVSPHQGPALGQ